MKAPLVLLPLALALAGLTGSALAGQVKSAGLTAAKADAAVGRRLAKLDANHDGKLSADELAGRRAGAKAHPKRLARLDTNHDGFVEPSELQARVDARFKRLDQNGDGVVTRAERQAARASRQPRA